MTNHNNDSDIALPKALTDFVFDLYDSVATSQLVEEQNRLYELVFRDLSSKYFNAQPWPSPQCIASECNGDPLFLAIYRELTHRHYHQIVASSRPSIRDCIEGWNVYRELFEEILESGEDNSSFYLLPNWIFDILQEFVYQFQGYCQIRSAVYASARKHGLLQANGSIVTTTIPPPSGGSGSNSQQHATLLDNLNLFETNTDAWDVEIVFSYLHRMIKMGFPTAATATFDSNNKEIPAVHTYLSIFSCIVLSRLECLLADYTSCLQALTPLAVHADYVIPKKQDESATTGGATSSSSSSSSFQTVTQVLHSTFTARLSMSYHAGVAYLMLRRYKDAINILGDMCAVMQRGFKTGALRKLAQSSAGGGGGGMLDQFNKQYERMLALLALLVFSICPSGSTSSAAATATASSGAGGGSSSSNNYFLLDDAVLRVLREKHASQLEAVTSNYDDWFQSPKFICIDPQATSAYRHQVLLFGKEMQPMSAQRKLRSYLKLYTSLPVEKLAKFHDLTASDFLPLLLSYKVRMRQLERPNHDTAAATAAAGVVGATTTTTTSGASSEGGGHDENKGGSNNSNTTTTTSSAVAVGYADGLYKTALDIHYFVTADNVVHMDEAEKQRRFENYFCAQIIQNEEILQDVMAIDTKV